MVLVFLSVSCFSVYFVFSVIIIMNWKTLVLLSLFCFISTLDSVAQTKNDSIFEITITTGNPIRLKPILVFNGTLIRDSTKYHIFYDAHKAYKGKWKSIRPTDKLKEELGINDKYISIEYLEIKNVIFDTETFKLIRIK